MAKAAKTKKKTKGEWDEGLFAVNRNAAGIDVGNADHYVAVPIGRDPEPVQTFGSFTSDLHRMAQWLKACGVETVVMQATGVYWIALFQILESYGFQVNVVNARHTKTLPGPQDRCVGMPMATKAAHLRTVKQFISPARGNPDLANLSSTTGKSGDCSEHMHPAHAENAHADERPVGQCNQRY